jgi:hypothetical protein
MKGTTRQSDVTNGLDLGDKRGHAVVLDAGGEEIEDRSIATTSVGLRAGLPGACRVRVGDGDGHALAVGQPVDQVPWLRGDRGEPSAGAAHP